jgi:hypothetical protein
LSLTWVPVSERQNGRFQWQRSIWIHLVSKNSQACVRNATDKLFEKVAARRAELEAELEKLAQYGKPLKKAESAPPPKAKKTEEAKEPKEAVAKAVIKAA